MTTPIGQIHLRTCREHKGRQPELYCQECDTLICLKCHFSTHKGHEVCELSDITSQTKIDIENFIESTEQNDLVQVRKYITATDTLLKDNSSNFEKLSEKLKIQTEKLKKDLDKLTEQTLVIYKQMEEDNIKLVQKYKQDLEIYNRELKQKVEKCKTALQQGFHIEIYDTGCEIHSQISLPVKPILGTASFTPNTNPQYHLKLALGSTDQDWPVWTTGVQKTSSFTTQQSEQKGNESVTTYKLMSKTKVMEDLESPCYIDSICPTTDGQVWTKLRDTLTLLDRKGQVIQKVKHNVCINNISLSPTTNRLWVCDGKNNILELISGSLTQRFSTKEVPWCICVTAGNHVIVGMTNNITKFTTQGQILQTLRGTGTGKPLVCTPHEVSECPVTHNVVVVDRNNKDDDDDRIPLVIVMDSDFKELFVYKGNIPSTYKQSSLKGAGPFNSWDVVYDSVGNIIIGDRNNKRVLLISGGGEFLRFIHTDKCWIQAVGIGKGDVLWAVFGGRKVKLLQYTQCVTPL